MKVHLQREIDKLKRHILSLGAEVENDVRTAVRSVDERNIELAEEVLKREDRVNTMEVDIEEECLKILALYQPVAGDLRYIIAVLKINQDLERIGDLAVHIAERCQYLCSQPKFNMSFRLSEMAEKVQAMLRTVLDALVNMDATAARSVCAADCVVDSVHREIIDKVRESVIRDPALFDRLLQVMHISRHLERIADHATNIAEDLIYMIEGRIVRHSPEVSDHATSQQS